MIKIIISIATAACVAIFLLAVLIGARVTDEEKIIFYNKYKENKK